MCKTLFLVIIAIVLCCEAKPKKVKCPDYCVCDIYENFNRATCTDKRLYSIEIDIPPQAQILNLAYNQISELGNNIFLEIGLTNLKLLNLTHNKVSQIHLSGFEGLSKLKTLDLSYNAVRYFMSSWFVSLNSLEELYLRGNNLRSINSEPVIDLKHLYILDLSSCGITSLSNDVLSKVPSLEVLDISDNYITFIEPQLLYPLGNLRILSIKNNPINCKQTNMAQLKNYTLRHLIRYQDPCKKQTNKSLQFERIVMDPVDDVEKNIWLFEDTENSTERKIVCNTNKNATNTNKLEDFLVEIIMLSPYLSVLVIFVTGLFIGLIIGCAVEIIPKEQKRERDDLPDGHCASRRSSYSIPNSAPIRERANSAFSNMRSLSRSLSRLSRIPNTRNPMERESLMMSQFDLADSTPVASRKIYVNI